MKILAISVCLAAACCFAPPSDSPRMEATGNVWQLKGPHSRGSGVPIGIHDGELWILTAKHLPKFDTATGWTAEHRDGTTLGEGHVIGLHPTEDAAILAFPLPDDEPFIPHLSFTPLELGEQVYGAGWGGGYYLWLTTGLVSDEDRVTSQIAPGDSGGGLFDEEGRLVAILVGRYGDAHMAAVVPLADIEEWLKNLLRGDPPPVD